MPSERKGSSEFCFIGPRDSVGPYRAIESFEREFPEILKTELLTNAQLGDHVRDQNLFRLGTGTESGCHLDR